MFTGIIETTAPVLSVLSREGILVLRIKKPKKWKLKAGQSIAIDGVCSTVAKIGRDFFEVEYMPETVRKTTAESFKKGRVVNLERSLTLQSFVDGHLVQGHVDGRAKVRKVTKDEKGYKVILGIPEGLERYVVEHGSVALNGVSLTVARKKGSTFTVGLIPYTLKATNLGNLGKGDSANIEVDMVARYLETLMR